MFNKRRGVSEILFLILLGVSSIYYFNIGQWKAYVRLFSILEIMVFLVASVLLF